MVPPNGIVYEAAQNETSQLQIQWTLPISAVIAKEQKCVDVHCAKTTLPERE